MLSQEELTTRLDDALREVGPIIDRPEPRRWSLKLPGQSVGSASGRADDGWFRVAVPSDGLPPSGWELLKLNALLPLAVRCALDPHTRRPTICSDVRVLHDTPLATRIQEACNGLVEAWNVVSDWERTLTDETNDRTPDDPDRLDEASQDTAAAMAECGWSMSERDGRPVIQIGVSSSVTAPATLRFHSDGGLRIDSTLSDDVGSTTVCNAIARCLLATTGVVRGVRARVRPQSGRTSVGLETGFDSTPSGAEARSALSALSVAWASTNREVLALQDPRVAEAYLAARH